MKSAMSRRHWSAVVAVALLYLIPAQGRELPDFTRLVEANGPAVVNISTTQKVKPSSSKGSEGLDIPGLPDDLNELFRRFFGDREGGDGAPEDFDAKSLGSGFIISRDGYILSNYHVVNEADEVIVRLSDRREFRAKVVGGDQRSDIALLKIDAQDLPMVTIGHSSRLKVGEWVLAIGSPFGFDHSATAGIVSALGRSLPTENYVPFIQTDVAINPGNSGGPLFNLDGEVVGVNSQIYSRTGGFMGLSFAIPIDVAMDVVEQLKSKGYVSRGWLGVLIQDVTRELAESFGMEVPEGALVAKVLPDSPAQAAGIEVGDIIVEFNGQRVAQSASLPPIVGRTPVGSSVQVKVLRSGKTKDLKVTLGELPSEEEVKQAAVVPQTSEENRLGVAVVDLTAQQRQELEIKDQGVLVEQIEEGPAEQAGVRQGDVILMINNVKVKDTKHFRQLVKELPAGKAVPLLVQRATGPVFLALKVPEE